MKKDFPLKRSFDQREQFEEGKGGSKKTDGNLNKSRNNGIAIIMDALYQPEELGNMSLSGNACPSSMPGSKPKPAIPEEVLDEIIGTLSTKPLFFLCIRTLTTFFLSFMVRY